MLLSPRFDIQVDAMNPSALVACISSLGGCLVQNADAIGVVANVAQVLAFFFIACALILQWAQNRRENKLAVREATWKVFDKWWNEMNPARDGFYQFINHHAEEMRNLREKNASTPSDQPRIGLGDVAILYKDYGPQVKQLVYFFDEVGWLAARELVESDFILGPMQHVLRRVWWSTDFLVEAEREPRAGKWLDPVRLWGLEWLYNQSEAKSQLVLLGKTFKRIGPLNTKKREKLEADIKRDEAEFKKRVGYSKV
jgi:preprotein translocase subunit SecG